jgi:hypothetical protein
MPDIHRKERIREYKETRLPAGVYVVRNTLTGKSLVGSSPNLPGMLNRQRFQLDMGGHPDKELQADWKESGPGSFEFEVLDQLETPEGTVSAQAEDLRALLAMWLEKLSESGVELYGRSLRRGSSAR